MIFQLALDSTALGSINLTLEPEAIIVQNPVRFGIFVGCLLVILISMLIFSIFSKDIIYPIAVIDYLCLSLLAVVQALEYPLYAVDPLVSTAYQLIADPVYLLLPPFLFYLSFKKSFSIYGWIVNALLIIGFRWLLLLDWRYPEWWITYASWQQLITPAIATVAVVEQLLRGKRPPLYYYLCLAMTASMILVVLAPIESEFSYLYALLPEFILYGILLYRFVLSIKNDKRKRIETAIEQGIAITHSLLETQENERARMARDLHDEVGSSLAALKLYAQSIDATQSPEIQYMIRQLDQCAQSVRGISHNLLPPEFTTTPIENLLEDHLRLIGEKSSLQFEFIAAGNRVTMPVEMKLMLYRIVLELVTNIIKHAKATQAVVQLTYYQDAVQLLCEDDGHGFKDAAYQGMGLLNARSRVEFLNGKMHIDSSERGTTIIIEWPVKVDVE